ncbi:TrkH family potassium uptake protein [Maritimibacter sp. HL-12]|jgi:trk system potassium uptake protein|uniref:TrkH family potassium uptake protein n=1 Tax=Maritimibacter sp. HL-12 TaxID=1162418 RepID=UPI000A0F08A2|nr:potassium transporter TrkG [Maritimibacter sp. HL-12]SMH55243.1 trk system potassium uptake protein TrkH [Maritimibacter sp. HL-12]
MFALIARLPLLVTLIGVGGVAMFIPAAHAAATGEAVIAEVFFYFGALSLLIALLIGIAMSGRARTEHPRRHLAALALLFVALPFLFALPFHQAVGNTTFVNAYVEMVSSLTTTGATMFERPGRLAPPLHTWRATVGWLGGLFIWVGAIAVLAPMALGGFEVRRRAPTEEVVALGYIQITERADLSHRVRVHAAQLLPIYAGLTLLLWIGLIVAGSPPAMALSHAMATLSTSGISPVGGLGGGGAGWLGEAMVAVFLVFALSRATFAPATRGQGIAARGRDQEIRLALSLVILLPVLLFARHLIGAYEIEAPEMSLVDGIATLWGSAFTVLSFLTTTGFESAGWEQAQVWSGMGTSGIILIGLALVGGGVATTAGGAKLLRVIALYRHGRREMERLVHPHSVGGAGSEARHLRRGGAYMAWLFFMLMTLSVALVWAGFAITGLGFEPSLVLAVSALTTTGPLAGIALPEPVLYSGLSSAGKVVLTVAMIIGRLETLAVVALFSPELWRR